MTHRLLLIFLLFVGLSSSSAHKFYVSVTSVSYQSEDEVLQCKLKIFYDDLENALTEYGGEMVYLCGDEGHEELMMRYISEKFKIKTDTKNLPLRLKEWTCDEEAIWITLQSALKETPQQIEVNNAILMELFEEQRNIIQFNINNKRKSLLLFKDKSSGKISI